MWHCGAIWRQRYIGDVHYILTQTELAGPYAQSFHYFPYFLLTGDWLQHRWCIQKLFLSSFQLLKIFRKLARSLFWLGDMYFLRNILLSGFRPEKEEMLSFGEQHIVTTHVSTA